MTRLEAAAEAAGLTVVTGARAKVLSMDGDRAVAVGIERRDGAREIVRTGAVILACNGYGGNRALVAEHLPEIAAAPYHGHPGNTGDAVLWGRALGAEERDMSACQGHGALAHPHGILITWALMMEGGIQVNSTGRRFSNEHLGYSEQAVRVLAQPGGIAWAIFDERLHDLGLGFPDYREAQAVGAVRRGDLPALAAATGLPEAGGAPDTFGRDFTGQPALGGKLCAIRVTGALFHTQGGLVVDEAARVTRRGGGVYPNLFAGGGAACGVSGARIEGYLSGNGLLSAIALGWVAGRQAARFSLAR